MVFNFKQWRNKISEKLKMFNIYFLYQKPYYYKSLINHNIIDTRRYYFNLKTTIEGSIIWNLIWISINNSIIFFVKK